MTDCLLIQPYSQNLPQYFVIWFFLVHCIREIEKKIRIRSKILAFYCSVSASVMRLPSRCVSRILFSSVNQSTLKKRQTETGKTLT
jgi:hypothetical protein